MVFVDEKVEKFFRIYELIEQNIKNFIEVLDKKEKKLFCKQGFDFMKYFIYLMISFKQDIILEC